MMQNKSQETLKKSTERLKLGSSSSTKEDLMLMKSEADRLRRGILDKKRIIEELERKASMQNDLQVMLQGIIEDYKGPKNFNFYDKELPELLDANKCISILREGVIDLLNKNSNIAQRFEMELKKKCFDFETQIRRGEKTLQKEEDVLVEEEKALKHRIKLVRMIEYQKELLTGTVLMRHNTIERHKQKNAKAEEDARQYHEQTALSYQEAARCLESVTGASEELNRISEVKENRATERLLLHKELLETRNKLDAALNSECFEHNKLMADLDNAKEKLSIVKAKADSFHANLKSHQLLDAEAENRRLKDLLRNETNGRLSKLKIQLSKTENLQKQIAEVSQSNAAINQNIINTEQRLQSLQSRIPDFGHLRQALERSIELARKTKAEVLRTQYMLDEIREKNARLQAQEIAESKARTESYLSQLTDIPSMYIEMNS